ncbi:MAG: HAD-IB family hydrolase [Bifidobacteriaceae bacterium]|jgi:HAD superfamily hydrolase (TIGR01490 family)|nr:HAD-IB family hydrolase [Bifidobacteriaceae bacterium]
MSTPALAQTASLQVLGRPETAPEPQGEAVAAFFDIDNTIIRGASAFHLAMGLRHRGILTARAILRFAAINARYRLVGENARDIDTTRDRSLGIIRGMPVALVVTVGEQVYDEVLAHRIYPGAKALLDSHRDAGHEVWLVSASPLEIGSLIAHRFHVTGALGTQVEHRDGFYTGRLVGGLLHGQAKADAVKNLAAQRGIDLAASYAYGDSVSDVSILSEVGHPCGINPDRKLRRYCASHSWPVREFRGRRRAVRRSLRAAYRVGGAWAVFAVLRALTRRFRPDAGR